MRLLIPTTTIASKAKTAFANLRNHKTPQKHTPCSNSAAFRIRCGRTIKGYPFNPLLTGDDYMILQQKIKNALEKINDEDLKGTYYPLEGMTKKVQSQLIDGIL